MSRNEPVAELDRPFSSGDATATPWARGREVLENAEIYWLSTVRPDGRPHVTPLVAVWLEDKLYFSTGPQERKAKNLACNNSCVITTGCNSVSDGLDLIVEGRASIVTDRSQLQRVSDVFASKYDPPFRDVVRDGALSGEVGGSHVYELTPAKAFGYGREKTFSATRWRF